MERGIVKGETDADQIVRFFEEILSKLPSGACSLRRKDKDRRSCAEVALIPTNESSAEFGAMFHDEKLYGTFFGRDRFFTTYEVPWELKLELSDGIGKQLAALNDMCQAVIAGMCEHRVTKFSVLGVIRPSAENVYRVWNLGIHPRRQRMAILYSPYYSNVAQG
jgi:hypothetical protein